MYNPCYLVRSRHAIFYFRYPVPDHHGSRISVSLSTRCPKEALRLAKMLEYFAIMFTNDPKTQGLTHAEVKERLRRHFLEKLEEAKRHIDKGGALSDYDAEGLRIERDDAIDALRCIKGDVPDEQFYEEGAFQAGYSFDDDAVRSVAEKCGISTNKDSAEFKMLYGQYGYALIEYFKAVLEYNGNANKFDFNESVSEASAPKPQRVSQEELRLSNVIDNYIKEIGGAEDSRNFRDRRDSLDYLKEACGESCLITDVDYAMARKIKAMLADTPKNRNKLPKTRKLALQEQIEAGAKYNLDKLSKVSINKYLGYVSALFRWAKQNKYVPDNPFEGMKTAESKGRVARQNFDKDEIAVILKGLSQMNTQSALGKTRYWGAMLLVYTGARLNEIASLTVDDVIKDKNTGIYHISITDDGESKKVKTRAAKRLVPIHSALIDAGFLDYVKDARGVVKKMSQKGELMPRLLYALTYNDEQWGRKIGRWFNKDFLVDLGLKSEKKTLHSLRHSFITYLNAAGVENATIQSLVGHEPDTVTTQVYTHYGEGHLPIFKKAIEKLPY